MANDSIKLYNFYRRYLWNENDFEGWQDGMVSLGRGMFEGTFGAAVLAGLGPTLTGGLGVDVSAGIACGPSGYLDVISGTTSLLFTAPTGYERALVVARPNVVPGDYMPSPTDPSASVPLTDAQQSVITIIRGTPANTPAYPATQSNDVVLFGVRLAAAQVTLAAGDIDLEVRDIPGKNSNFQQDAAKYDNRLRPYISGTQSIGIKPSQLEPPFPRVFSYVNKATPSIWPKTALGVYNGSVGDTYVNFQTGVVTGADEDTPDFTPTIPTAGNAIVACISLLTTDRLAITYGTIGTRAQCLAGIKSQVAAGAGSVAVTTGAKPITFVILFSQNGTAITEMDLFDCRGMVGAGTSAAGIAGGGSTSPVAGLYPLTLTSTDDGRVINVITTAARTVNLPAPVAGFKVTIKDYVGTSDSFPITIGRSAGGVKIEALAVDYSCKSPFGSWTFFCDGTDYWVL